VTGSSRALRLYGWLFAAGGAAFLCAHCGAEFSEPMKFCGACGKEMA